MKSYYELIKENLIDFEKVLIDNYYKIGLNETECLILLRLFQQSKKGNNILNADELIKKLSISSEKFTEVISGLVNRDFIELSLELDKNQSYTESFSLEGSYRQLGYVFEDKETKEEENTISIEMKQTMQYLEKQLGKMLTPLEINIFSFRFSYDTCESLINIRMTVLIIISISSIIERFLIYHTS